MMIVLFCSADFRKYSPIETANPRGHLRIPAGIMKAAQLNLDDAVDVREEAGRIVIEPIRARKYDLAELLARITAKNLHREIVFGYPVGKELL